MQRTTMWRSAAGTLGALAILGVVAACGGNAGTQGPSDSAVATSGASTGERATPSTSSAPATVSSTAARSARQTGIPAQLGGIRGPAHSDATAPVSSPPVRVRIPAIGVDSSLQALGLEKDGSLETPSQWQVAGWYAGGVRPGDDGPAVIAGHVDSVNGPAVFYRLTALKAGDKVYVARKNGSTVTFTVASTAEYPKRTFPTDAVYGPSPLPTLRLVTCTGDFDYAKRSYVDNLVVTAYAG